ncbi:hypothetical protein DL765_007475 [Monosporascus sp. GIB2]|nr:hypothetical protein DL765_007475 [Monosporascus sp. GIB2]
MEKRLRPLAPDLRLPGEGRDVPPEQKNVNKHPTKRQTSTIVACDPCRKRKCKCDGEKSGCGPCSRRNNECTYSEEKTGRADIMRLRKLIADLQMENGQLRELYRLFGELSNNEVHEVLKRIRSAEEPVAILGYIKELKTEST